MSNFNSPDLEYWREDVLKIKEDSISSSLIITEQALEIIEDFIDRKLYKNRTELLQNLAKLSNALIRSKPLMALLFTYSHRIMDYIQAIPRQERDINVIKELSLAEIHSIRQRLIENKKNMIRMGIRIILDHHTVLTHSASGVVEAILMEARRLKRRFQVICTESRPLMEGKAMAARLAKAGIKTTVITDGDLYRAISESNLILTGADRLTENSFINKTGTAAIGIIARELNKPLYVAADTDKILLKRTYPIRLQPAVPTEIIERETKNLTADNYYFEEINFDYLHKIICELSIFDKEEFLNRFI